MSKICAREFTEHEYARARYLGGRGELTVSNGDKATGEATYDASRMWFRAVDNNGREYETDEMPVEVLPITIIIANGERYIVGK